MCIFNKYPVHSNIFPINILYINVYISNKYHVHFTRRIRSTQTIGEKDAISRRSRHPVRRARVQRGRLPTETVLVLPRRVPASSRRRPS